MPDQITIRGARLHNLKNITLTIPKNRLVVLTGVSGSGKSTLGFDLLYKEGQRQYLEALGLIAFDLAKPPVDSIRGLSPTICVDQHLTNRSPRSTVGTVTDVYTYLRVLYARLGYRQCPSCGGQVPPPYDPLVDRWEPIPDFDGDTDVAEQYYPCPQCGALVAALDMANFSFNKPAGACPTCTGLGRIQQVDTKQLVDEQKSIAGGAVICWNAFLIDYHTACLKAAAAHYGFVFDPFVSIKEYSPQQKDLLFYGVQSPLFQRHFPRTNPPSTVRKGRFEGIATNLLRRYSERILDMEYREKMEGYLITQTCPDCAGMRLRSESRNVLLHGKNIVTLSRLSLDDLSAWLDMLSTGLKPDEKQVAFPILNELNERLQHLMMVGAGYLILDRSTPSLSAGEAQRLRLAALLGSGLTGVLYVLDEPTIGTHQKDTRRLIEVLQGLRDLGNTVLVIEHDLEVIAAADHVIDFGPGGGKYGGQLVAIGSPAEIMASSTSVTGDYLSGRKVIAIPEKRRQPTPQKILIRGARHHNLKNITVQLPLGVLVAVTGVSGSGKSTLIFDILERAIRLHLNTVSDIPGEYESLAGWEQIKRIIAIDQQHIGRIPRSNVATYAEIFTPIREVFSASAEAKKRGYSAKQFSFNVPGGRCERCQGSGVLLVNMHFLPEAELRCPGCHGRRFKRETLEVRYKEHDIAKVLELTVEEALTLFAEIPTAAYRLKLLTDVGLGYLQLGQPATTLSGGEAQRVKLAKELGRHGHGHTLYLLDEPTAGLHLADTARLLSVLQQLVEEGNSVVVIEHNLQLIKTADWIIDLGPEGGEAGGQLVAEGTPEQIVQVPRSHTGNFLREILRAPSGNN